MKGHCLCGAVTFIAPDHEFANDTANLTGAEVFVKFTPPSS